MGKNVNFAAEYLQLGFPFRISPFVFFIINKFHSSLLKEPLKLFISVQYSFFNYIEVGSVNEMSLQLNVFE